MKVKQELWLRYNLAVWARNPSVCILPHTLATPPVTLLCSEIFHQNIKFLTILPVLVDIFGFLFVCFGIPIDVHHLFFRTLCPSFFINDCMFILHIKKNSEQGRVSNIILRIFSEKREGYPQKTPLLVLLCLFLALFGPFFFLFGPYLTLLGENIFPGSGWRTFFKWW